MKAPNRLLKFSPFIAMTSAILFHAFIVLPAHASQGDRGGNGGISMVCRDSQGAISSVQMLDLAEYPGMIQESNASAGTQFSEALARLRAAGQTLRAGAIEMAWKQLQRRIQFISRGASLSPTGDSSDVYGANSPCIKEQLAVYKKELDTLFINPVLYEKLSPTQLAALMLHESIFKLVKRGNEDASSLQTRAFVRTLLHPGTPVRELTKAAECIKIQPIDYTSELYYELRDTRSEPVTCQGDCNPKDVLGKYILVSGDEEACDPAIRIEQNGRTIEATIRAIRPETESFWYLDDNILRSRQIYNLNNHGTRAYGIDGVLKIANIDDFHDDYKGIVNQSAGHLRLVYWKYDGSILGINVRFLKGHELYPTPQGRLQVQSWAGTNIDNHDFKYEDISNCLYERRVK